MCPRVYMPWSRLTFSSVSFLTHVEKNYINIINFQVFNNLQTLFFIKVAQFKQHSLILASDFNKKAKKAVKLTRRHTASSTGHVCLCMF